MKDLKISRLRIETLATVSLLGIAASALAVAPSPARAQACDAPVELEFTVWNYSVDTILDNIAKFQAENPDITVKLTDYAWPDYHDTMVLRFRNNPPDIAYSGEDWLPEWASAGWLAPLEEIVPDVAKYKDVTVSYALNDMTFEGTLYGLPYYADLITFQYNKDLLGEHGIEVPQTWTEVRAAADTLAAAGIEKPFVYEYNQELPNFYSAFVSQVYGRGGRMFDDELNPLFDDPNSEAFKQLEWLQSLHGDGLMALETHETKVVPAMNTGKHAFTVLFNYNMAAMNNAANSRLAGSFDVAKMPGAAHGAYGFAKFYSMTSKAAEDPCRRDAAWRFIEYMGGGDFAIAERWAVEKGLGFGQLPLFDNAEVQETWGEWINPATFKEQAQLAQNAVQTPWKGIWSDQFRPILAKAMVGDMSVQEAMDEGARLWNELKSQFGQ